MMGIIAIYGKSFYTLHRHYLYYVRVSSTKTIKLKCLREFESKMTSFRQI